MQNELLPYYDRELAFLRELGKEFAAQYPKVAGRLLLEEGTTEDPHVERLIEAFAFLTARINLKLDDEFPEITDALLGILYPHLLRPIPSMSIVQMVIDPDQMSISGRYTVPRHAELFSRPVEGVPCRFRSCYPVDLWPLRVAEAKVSALDRIALGGRGVNAAGILRIRLKAMGGVKFSAMGLDRLRFFLDGDGRLVHTLYELLFNNVVQVAIAPGSGDTAGARTLPPGSIRPVGFEEDEGMLDYDARSAVGYRLLHEYFVFPEKFLFFDLVNLEGSSAPEFGEDLEIRILLREFEGAERLQRLVQSVHADTFRTGCTPVINLFRQNAEPMQVSHQRTEYAVLPDLRRPWGMEVYSVDSVRRLTKSEEQSGIVDFHPFYSLRHGLADESQTTFWHATRRPSPRQDDNGSEVFLSLVDLAFNPSVPAAETLLVAVTCTNRDLPSLLPFGGEQGDFQVEGGSAVSRIRCLRKPTATLRPAQRRGAMWQLVSHLSLNHLSIVEGGREALLEILSLYNFSGSLAVRKQISGITAVRSEPVMAKVGPPHRPALVRGTLISLEFDEEEFVGAGVFLMAAVLERFFALYSAINSFTQLEVKSRQREEVLAAWPPRAGNAILA